MHEAQIIQINELDKAMGIFETINPELFKDCKLVRALLDSGGGAQILWLRLRSGLLAHVCDSLYEICDKIMTHIH